MDTQKKKRIMKKKDTVRTDVIYSRCTITRPVQLNMKQVGKTLKSSLERKVKAELDGEVKGELIQFQTIVDCLVCFPVEGMLVQCVAKNITKAGIRAEIQGEAVSPIVCFISRDHHVNSSQFAVVTENDPILVRIIGQRFELNDNFISAIGELVVDKDKQNANRGTRRRQTDVAAKD